MPLFQLIERHVLAAERLHGDDTTIRILAKGKCTTGRICTYLWTVPALQGHLLCSASGRLQLSIRLYGDATSLDEIRGSAPNYVDEL
ncbi:Transposase IS66 family protein [Bradyrhizobium yuanmingense]|uniref:Transposase IS66 family protein n=1 Tax=Bradyrhizobium yuanmingense TaxID=108015 RepID=A0A1C3XJC2_9BRAD|nr:transposase IS66 family protein [Bradyrhizobium yuanmingense]SCB52299.1 Transposase IS66 family protein [Bradyrhizobium yuanmingense]